MISIDVMENLFLYSTAPQWTGEQSLRDNYIEVTCVCEYDSQHQYIL